MAWYTLQGCSWEEAGVRCCFAGTIPSDALAMFLYLPRISVRKTNHAADGAIPVSTRNTTRSTRSILFYSGRRVSFGYNRLGDHKPMQVHWLAWLFGGYNAARVWHFCLMWVFILFIAPHVILVFARRGGTHWQHDRGLVNKSEADGAIRKMSDDKKSDSLRPEEIRSTDPPYQRTAAETDEAGSSVAVGSLSMKKPQASLKSGPSGN